MPKRNKYALIAKDNNSVNYKFISFDEEQITKLEKIDLYTMHFDNKDELVDKLVANGQIDNSDVDVFVVCSKNDGKEITFMEPLYFGPNYYLSKDLVEIIPQFLKRNVAGKENYDHILKEFEKRIIEGIGFFEMVIRDKTNLYGKFSDYIRQSKRVYGFMDKIKHNDGHWIYSSYPLIRNIVEAINRYDEISRITRDVFHKNSEIYYNKKKSREIIIPSLKEKFKSDYIIGQISMFDMLSGNSNIEIVEAPEVAEIKETPRKTKISRLDWKEEIALYNDVDIATKLSEITDILWALPRNVLIQKKEDGKTKGIIFNEDVFEYYEDEKSKKILNTGLGAKLIKYIDLSLVYRDSFERALKNYGNTAEVQREMRYYRKCVVDELKKDKDNYKILNKAYIWCRTYIDCRDKDLEYRNSK